MKELDESNFCRRVKKKNKDCLNKESYVKYLEKFFTKQWLTSHIEREHQPNVLDNPSNNNNNHNKTIIPVKQKPDNDPNVSTYENHRHVIISPSNACKTYYMLKILE